MADTDTLAPPDDTAKRLSGATATKAPPPDYSRLSGMFGLGKTRQTLDEDRAAIDAAKPGPPALTPPPLQPPPTDPLQAFGQPAMWLAALGGLLTRHPLTSAITSAGAVMDSVHRQDDAAAQRAFEEWKVHSANAEKLIRYEQEAYKAAIAKYATDARAGEAQIKTLAAAFKNPALAQVLEQEGMTGVTAYVKANGQQADRASVAATSFTDYAGKKISIAQGLLSDDPKQMADALRAQGDAFVHDASGKGSTSGSRMQADAIRLQLGTIAAKMEKAAEDGDQAGVDAAVAEAREIAGAGTASLKPPKVNAKAAAEGKPQLFVDADNTPFQVVIRNGVATVLDMQGKPYTATTFAKPGTAETPHVAERRDAAQDERAKHDTAIEKIQNDRTLKQAEKDQKIAAENVRWHDLQQSIRVTDEKRKQVADTEKTTHDRRLEEIQTDRIATDAQKADRVAAENERWHGVQEWLKTVDETRLQGIATETARHNAEVAAIQTHRDMTGAQRAAAELAERTRHDHEVEDLMKEKEAGPGTTGADRTAIAADVLREHPDWSEGQQAEETERRFKAASAAASSKKGAPWQEGVDSTGTPFLWRPDPEGNTEAKTHDGKAYEPKGAISKPPPAPEPGTELSPEGKKYAVDIYRRTGQLPAGWGAAGIRQKNEIIDEAGRQSAAEGGGAASDLGVRADVHAETQALTTLGRTRANVRNFEETARKEADLAVSLMDKGAARGGVPLVNRWVLAGRRSVEGDPDVVKFDTAITSFKNEYARIMSAPGATGGMTSDAARAEAESLINRAGTKAQLNGVIQTMKIGMDNRIAAINDEYAATEKRIKEAGGGELAPVAAHPDVPATLSGKPGLAWSASRKQWRDSTGAIYDADGNPVQ